MCSWFWKYLVESYLTNLKDFGIFCNNNLVNTICVKRFSVTIYVDWITMTFAYWLYESFAQNSSSLYYFDIVGSPAKNKKPYLVYLWTTRKQHLQCNMIQFITLILHTPLVTTSSGQPNPATLTLTSTVYKLLSNSKNISHGQNVRTNLLWPYFNVTITN